MNKVNILSRVVVVTKDTPGATNLSFIGSFGLIGRVRFENAGDKLRIFVDAFVYLCDGGRLVPSPVTVNVSWSNGLEEGSGVLTFVPPAGKECEKITDLSAIGASTEFVEATWGNGWVAVKLEPELGDFVSCVLKVGGAKADTQ